MVFPLDLIRESLLRSDLPRLTDGWDVLVLAGRMWWRRLRIVATGCAIERKASVNFRRARSTAYVVDREIYVLLSRSLGLRKMTQYLTL